MGFLWMIKKDLLLFVREKKSTLLLLLLPLTVIGIVGSVFGAASGISFSTPVGICNRDAGNLSEQFIDALHRHIPLKIYPEADCEVVARQDVFQGTTAAATFIPENFTAGIVQGRSQDIGLIVDNSRAQTAWATETTIKGAFQELSRQISIAFISQVWEKLGEANSTIDPILHKLNTSMQKISDTRATLANLSQAIDAIDTAKMKSDVNQTINYLNTADSNLNQAAVQLAQMKQEAPQLNQQIAAIETLIAATKGHISNVRSQLDLVEQAIDQLALFKAQATWLFNESNATITYLLSEAAAIESALTDAKKGLSEIISRNPEEAITPIIVRAETAFPSARYIHFLIPGIAGIVTMFIALFLSSVSLVREKNSGTFVRNLLSPMSILSFTVQKAVSALFLTILPVIVLFAIGVAVFEVFIPLGSAPLLILTMMLLALVFVGIGLIIAFFSESENTALLGSLMIGLPLLFVSGIFFPLEMMPPAMASVAQLTPITQGIEVYKKIVFYNVGFEAIGPFLAYLAAAAVISVTAAYLLFRVRGVR